MKANKLDTISLREAFNYFYKKDGIQSFYKGVHSAIPMSLINVYCYFYIYETMNKKVLEMQKSLDKFSKGIISFLLPFASAAMAECSVMSWYIPCDVIRTRLQSNESQYDYKGMVDGLIKTYQREGLGRLYAASHLYLSSQVIYTSIEFGTFEFLRKQKLMISGRKGLELLETLGISIMSGALAAVVINPLDLIVIRYQMTDTRAEKLQLFSMTRDIIKIEGIKAFYKGLGARISYSMIYGLFMFPVYEYLRTNYGVDMLDI